MANLYREVSESEWRALPADSCQHAAHAMLYSPWPGKLFGKYEFKYAVLVSGNHTPFSIKNLALYFKLYSSCRCSFVLMAQSGSLAALWTQENSQRKQ